MTQIEAKNFKNDKDRRKELRKMTLISPTKKYYREWAVFFFSPFVRLHTTYKILVKKCRVCTGLGSKPFPWLSTWGRSTIRCSRWTTTKLTGVTPW
jgi:hypothetical protein